MSFARVVLFLACSLSAHGFAQFSGQSVAPRRSKPTDFALPAERRGLPNGLVVLVSPDEGANEVAVEISFGCGALAHSSARGGLAHLAEHALASGPTPDTDYQAMLEANGATDFNGSTTLDSLSYSVVVPPEALALALWVHADRLGRRETLTTPEALARHRRIVLQEKLARLEDAPYGAATRLAFRGLFAKSHPLHEGVIGTAATLEAVTVDDVNAFARACLTPDNAVLTLAGRFTPAEALAAVEATLGRLPRGSGAPPLPRTAKLQAVSKLDVPEDVARRARVTLMWPLPALGRDEAYALSLGATLLPIYTDGLNGMEVASVYLPSGAGGLFALSVTTPRPADASEPRGNAEVVLRNLTFNPLPADVVAISYKLLDLHLLARLSSMSARAALLSALHREAGAEAELPPLDRHWRYSPEKLHADTKDFFKGAHVSVESKPTRPLPPKVRAR
ncbi:MAG: insulinase family protein [Myxococcaceae bacterium]|nr:insulinase family protein [Myxococcaceae bacterium]MCA3012223.1 insulinase family protein [Myxococcaceae bacterium]